MVSFPATAKALAKDIQSWFQETIREVVLALDDFIEETDKKLLMAFTNCG